MLTPQKGMLLCTDHGCLDNVDVEQRDRVIAEVLRGSEENKVELPEIAFFPTEDISL